MINQPLHKKRLYILDTNVMMHDPTALFRFSEHDVFLPMAVLEELDHAKKGVSEVARNVRQVSRFLDDLISQADLHTIANGVRLQKNPLADSCESSGMLRFQTTVVESSLPSSLPGKVPDNEIINVALSLQKKLTDTSITLVSKDINLRLKASILGLHTEDYYNDKVLDDVDLLFKGIEELEPEFWNTLGNDVKSWKEKDKTFYEIKIGRASCRERV